VAISAETRSRIQSEFPAFASLLGIPDVANVLGRAIDEGWDIGKLQANLYATGWWKRNSEAQRNAYILLKTDPGSYRRNVQQIRTAMTSEARRLGIRASFAELTWLSTQGYNEGWSTEEITRRLIQVGGKRDAAGGSIRANASQIYAMAQAYGITISGKNALSAAKSVAMGDKTLDGLKNSFHERALWKYAAQGNEMIVNGLKQGMTLAEVMDPTLSLVAEELELNPDSFNLGSGLAKQLINFRDPETKQYRMPTDSEAIQFARSQGQWRDTGRAKSLVTEATNGIAQYMGAKR
jgi:hypothetical protein